MSDLFYLAVAAAAGIATVALVRLCEALMGDGREERR